MSAPAELKDLLAECQTTWPRSKFSIKKLPGDNGYAIFRHWISDRNGRLRCTPFGNPDEIRKDLEKAVKS